MTSPPRGLRGAWRLVARLWLLSVLIVTACGLTATAASAHHPEIDATADCAGVVTFTVTAWTPPAPDDTAARTNPRIEVDYLVDGETWTPLPWQEAHHFGADNDFSFSDTVTLDMLPASVTVRATAKESWGNGAPPGPPSHSSRSTTVTFPTDCPTGPTAEIGEVHCPQGGAEVTVANDSASPTTLTVRVTPQHGEPASTQVTVPAGHTVSHLAEVEEDTTATVDVLSDGRVLATRGVTRDCGELAPTAEVTLDCEAGVQVVLDNSASTESVAYKVHGPHMSRRIAVPAGESQIHTYDLPADTHAAYRVDAPGMDPIERTIQRDCTEPGPVVDVTSDCDVVVLMLGNEGTDTTVFTVAMPDGSAQRLTVQPGGDSVELTFLPADAGSTVTVAASGMDDVVVPVPEGCDPGPRRSSHTRPAPWLAETGASVLPLIVVAAGMLALGGLALVLARRRRAARHARK